MRPGGDYPSAPVRTRMVARNLKLPDFVNIRFSRRLSDREIRRLRDILKTFFDVEETPR